LRTGKILYAADFGVDQNPETDDTVSIQNAFDAAAKQKDCLLVFPAGIFTLSDTINLPANVIVRGVQTP
jgi:polygalacturonase